MSILNQKPAKSKIPFNINKPTSIIYPVHTALLVLTPLSPTPVHISLSIIPQPAAYPPQSKMMTSQHTRMIQPENSIMVAMPRNIYTTMTHSPTSRLLTQKYKNHATQYIMQSVTIKYHIFSCINCINVRCLSTGYGGESGDGCQGTCGATQ